MIAPTIKDVLLTPLQRIAHPQGEVLHAIKRSSPGFVGFGEAYFSTVLPGEIKGWKRHRRVTLNLVVPVGTVHFVIFDDRSNSPSAGCFNDFVMGKENYARLTIPPGLWVAFRGLDENGNMLINLANEEHDPTEFDNVGVKDIPFDWNQ